MDGEAPQGPVRAISAWAFSPERDLLAIAGGPPVWLTWGLTRPAWLRTRHSDPADWYVSLVDTRTRAEVGRLLGPRWICTTLAFSPDGTRVAAACTDLRIHVWDVARREAVQRLKMLTVPIALQWCGADCLVARSADRSVRRFDVVPSAPSNEVKAHARHADPPEG